MTHQVFTSRIFGTAANCLPLNEISYYVAAARFLRPKMTEEPAATEPFCPLLATAETDRDAAYLLT